MVIVVNKSESQLFAKTLFQGSKVTRTFDLWTLFGPFSHASSHLHNSVSVIPLEKLPIPPRKPSLKVPFLPSPIQPISLDRDFRDFFPGKRFLPKTASVVEPAITKPPVTRRVASSDPENREPLKPPGLVSGAVRQSNKFVWEQTLLETAKEAGPESQENCQHQ